MLTVLDILHRLGLFPTLSGPKNGGEYASACPFCGGRDRFRSWPADKRWGEGGCYWCRGCGAKGDAIQLVRDAQGLNYADARKALGLAPDPARKLFARRLFSRPNPQVAWTPSEHASPPDLWRMKAGEMVLHAESNLWDRRVDVLEWLETRRGVRRETAERFRLGWLDADTWRPATAWGINPIKEGKPPKLYLPEGLVIPVFGSLPALDCLPVRAKIRRPNPERGPEWARETRYWQVKGGGQQSWLIGGVDEYRRAVVLVETELDAILLAQEVGDLCAVLALGSAQAKPDMEATAHIRRAAVILDALDYDRAGADAHRFWAAAFPRSIRRWPVPEGKDPGEAWAAGVDIREWICASLPPGLVPGMDSDAPDETSPESSSESQAEAAVSEAEPDHGRGRVFQAPAMVLTSRPVTPPAPVRAPAPEAPSAPAQPPVRPPAIAPGHREKALARAARVPAEAPGREDLVRLLEIMSAHPVRVELTASGGFRITHPSGWSAPEIIQEFSDLFWQSAGGGLLLDYYERELPRGE